MRKGSILLDGPQISNTAQSYDCGSGNNNITTDNDRCSRHPQSRIENINVPLLLAFVIENTRHGMLSLPDTVTGESSQHAELTIHGTSSAPMFPLNVNSGVSSHLARPKRLASSGLNPLPLRRLAIAFEPLRSRVGPYPIRVTVTGENAMRKQALSQSEIPSQLSSADALGKYCFH